MAPTMLDFVDITESIWISMESSMEPLGPTSSKKLCLAMVQQSHPHQSRISPQTYSHAQHNVTCPECHN